MNEEQYNHFIRELDGFMRQLRGGVDPREAFLEGWLANNNARMPVDTGEIWPNTDARILDLIDDLMATLTHHRGQNHLVARGLETALTPLLRLAYAEIDKAQGKAWDWNLIPRRHHPINHHFRGFRF